MKGKIVKSLLATGMTLTMLMTTACGGQVSETQSSGEQGETTESQLEDAQEDKKQEAEKQGETAQTDEGEEVYVDNPDRSDEGYVLIWSDEFEGEALDKTKWFCQIGTGASEGLTDWGNQELEYYTDREENVRVENGELIITAVEEEKRYGGKLFTSARIRTITDEDEVLFSTKYGRVEARIKLPAGEGLWPAFWMLPVDDSIYKKWAASGEIDIMEARGRVPDRVEGTIHYGQNWPNNVYKGEEFVFPEDTDTTEYHLYSLEWEPGVLRWYVDDECYHTTEQWFSKGSASATDYTYPAPFDVPYYILLNLAVGGTFDLEANPYGTEYPAQMKVDYVRVYQKEEGYAPVSSDAVIKADNKDKEGFEQYAASYTDGEFMADPEFATMNLEPIEDTNKGIIPESKDWQFAVGNFGGQAKASVETLEEGNFAKIEISSGGTQSYAIQLIQHMPMIEGYSYMVSFDAKASAERNFFVSPSGDLDNAWEKYGLYEASVGTEVSNHNFVFEMNSKTDPTARLEFNLGNKGGTVWIGNVSVTELKSEDGLDHDMKKAPLSDGNRIYNGTFDQGVQRIAFWHMTDMEASIPDFVTAEDGSEDYSRMAQLKAVGTEACLYQNGIQVNGGADYTMSMDMYGENAMEIKVCLIGSDGTVYLEDVLTYDGSGEKMNSALTFRVPDGIKDDNAVVEIQIPEESSIQVDNVYMGIIKE